MMPGGQINDPLSGKHYSLPFLPATASSPSRTLGGLFELTTTENQGHSQFCCAGRGGPRKPSKTTDANLDCAFVENALAFTNP